MSGLNASLSLATQSILAQDGALQVTNNNISNANTPGYSRQIVTLNTSASVNNGNAVENGVVLQGFESVRSQVIQQNLQAQTSAGSSADTQASALELIQSSFTSSTTDIGSSMSALFASISNLSTNSADPATRQAVLSAAGTLTTAFHQASASLTQAASNANDQVTQDVAQINQLTSQIAQVSKQIGQVKPNGGNTGSLEDQREQLVLQLSKLTSVSETATENGVTLTTGNGVPLVVAGQSYSLQTKTGADGYKQVLSSSGQDITSTLSGGSLGGSLQLRDGTAASLLNQLDTLSNQFATAMNNAQGQGFDSTGARAQTSSLSLALSRDRRRRSPWLSPTLQESPPVRTDHLRATAMWPRFSAWRRRLCPPARARSAATPTWSSVSGTLPRWPTRTPPRPSSASSNSPMPGAPSPESPSTRSLPT